MYRVPLHDRLLYASGSLGSQAVLQALLLWVLFFYQTAPGDDREALVPLAVLGGLVFAGRLVDVVTDPLVGFWSDRTSTRWGRRIPFILGGAPLATLAFVLLWTPPEGMSQTVNALYLLVVLGLFFLAHTLSGRPYDALLPELGKTSHQRVNLSALRVFLGTIGGGIGLVASGLLVENLGFLGMGLIIGGIALGARLASVVGAWRWVARDAPPATVPLWTSLRTTFQSRAFQFYLPSFVLYSMALTMLVQTVPFFAQAILGLSEGQASLLLGAFFVTTVICLYAIQRLADARGKGWTYSTALLLTALTLPFLFFVGFLPGVSPVIQAVVFLAVLGATMSGLFALPAAIMGDIIDDDAARNGQRREAIYYGTEQLVQKIGIAAGVVVLTQGLEFFGFSPEEPLGLRLVGPAAGVLVLIGFAVFRWGYPLEEPQEPRARE